VREAGRSDVMRSKVAVQPVGLLTAETCAKKSAANWKTSYRPSTPSR
jgi:hypothetical protein